MTGLDARLNAFRPDLADITLKDRVEAARVVPGLPYRVTAAQAPVRSRPSADSTLLT